MGKEVLHIISGYYEKLLCIQEPEILKKLYPIFLIIAHGFILKL